MNRFKDPERPPYCPDCPPGQWKGRAEADPVPIQVENGAV